MYYFYVNIIMFYKQAARRLFIATITGSLSDIVLAYILVKYLGMYGSAIAFVLAKIITIFIVVYISKLYDDAGYSVIKMLSIIIPSLLFMAVGLYFSYTKYLTVFNLKNLVYKILILCVYVLFIYFTNKKEINKIIKTEYIKKIIKRKNSEKIVDKSENIF